MLISVASVFLPLWRCSTESPEHPLDGSGYTYLCLIPRDAVWWRKKGHITQASIKLLWRGQHQCLLFLYFSFLFNQEEKSCPGFTTSLKQGKSNLAFICKGTLCADISTTGFHCIIRCGGFMCQCYPGSCIVRGWQHPAWERGRELRRQLTGGRDCRWGRRGV